MPLNFVVMSDPPAVCMYDDGTEWAFGPVVKGDDAMEKLAAFIEALGEDPRTMSAWGLEFAWAAWEARARELASDDAPKPMYEEFNPPAPEKNLPASPNPDDVDTLLRLPATEPATAMPEPLATPAVGASTDGASAFTPAPQAPSVAVAEPVTPPGMPVGSRVCWNCNGHRVEPNGTNDPCGICVAKGWLPA